MTRPSKFEHHRYVGDKRTQRVLDLDDEWLDPEAVEELMASEQFTCFAPDTLAEARNRGYRLSRSSGTGRLDELDELDEE